MDIKKINLEDLPALRFHEEGDEYVLIDGIPIKEETIKSLTEATKLEVEKILTKFDSGSNFGLSEIAAEQQQVTAFLANCQPFSSHYRVEVLLNQLQALNEAAHRNQTSISAKIKQICVLLGNLGMKGLQNEI